MENYGTRYREGLDLVVKGIDCSIKPGEKVGGLRISCAVIKNMPGSRLQVSICVGIIY